MKSLGQLRSALSQWNYDFPSPDIELEQYQTPTDIASFCIWTAYLNGDIADKIVIDLGCGTGVLSQASRILGAACTFGIDFDRAAMLQSLEIAEEGILTDCSQLSVTHNSLRNFLRIRGDVVVTNPPFGTKNQEHADTIFVREALSIADVVYSFHLSTSYDFLQAWVTKEFENVTMKLVARVDYAIEKTYKKHRKPSKVVKVDILRWSV